MVAVRCLNTEKRGRFMGKQINPIMGIAMVAAFTTAMSIVPPAALAEDQNAAVTPAQDEPKPEAKADGLSDFIDLSALVMQPVYLGVRVPMAIIGGAMGGVVWAVTGGNSESAREIWDASLGGSWGWPEFVRSHIRQTPETP
jgi:hypothetical protein